MTSLASTNAYHRHVTPSTGLKYSFLIGLAGRHCVLTNRKPSVDFDMIKTSRLKEKIPATLIDKSDFPHELHEVLLINFQAFCNRFPE